MHRQLPALHDRVAVGRTPRTLIWSLGRVQLFRYTPTLPPAQHQPTPLLLVYALINKPYIFDLLPGRIMKGEGEYLVIGGEYRVRQIMCTL